MNMNLDIVNRALYATGQEPLEEVGKAEIESTVYKLCKSFYISAFLEALSEVEWVGGRKRVTLARTGLPVIQNRKYAYAYDIPYDCAKPIELQDNEYFVVEDRLIMTDVPDAELLYVSNGKVLRPIAAAVMKLGERPENEYLSAGPPGTIPDITLYSGNLASLPRKKDPLGDYSDYWYVDGKITDQPVYLPVEIPNDPAQDSDYPDYVELDYEPKFFEYIEKKLAAKFAMKLSEQPKLHMQLLQEALLVKQEAVDASRASRAAKVKEKPWWSDELGIG